MFEMVCTRCGSISRPKKNTPGSFLVELLLFLMVIASLLLSPIFGFIVPIFIIVLFLLYGIWRLTARKKVCRVCFADSLIPIDSPVGEAMAVRKSNNDTIPAQRPKRFRLIATLIILIVVVIVFGNWISRTEPSGPAVIVHGPDYDKPANPASGKPPAVTLANDTATTLPNIQQEAPSVTATADTHELREDGRVYSVALIVGTPEIPVGEKLLAQGRIDGFDYASGVRSRPFVLIKDEQETSKTMVCAMTENEVSDVVSLYRVGEVVAVSGEYIATSSINGYPSMPIIRDCHVAGRQENIVRPTPPAAPIVSTETPQQQIKTITVIQGSCGYDIGLCTADAVQKTASTVTILWLACRTEQDGCTQLTAGEYAFDVLNSDDALDCRPIKYPGATQKAFCVQLHAGPYNLIYSMQPLKETSTPN